MEFSAENQRRTAVRVLRPWLGSVRLVALFCRIGQLSVCRPGAVDTIDLFVERLRTRRAAADLAAERDRAVS